MPLSATFKAPKKETSIQREERQLKAVWRNMIRKCYSATHSDYHYYGGRGIVVCWTWGKSFEQFKKDLGPRPKGYTLERTDNDGPYSKMNCKWASRSEQQQNTRATRRITFQNTTKSVGEWARSLGIARSTLSNRLNRYGWTLEQAFTVSVEEHRGQDAA